MIFKKIPSKFALLSAIFQLHSPASAYALSQSYDEIVQNLYDYCGAVREDVQADVFPLRTDGISYIDAALTNSTFTDEVCLRVEPQRQKDCAAGIFSLSNELLGLKNSINLYNQDHSKVSRYMILSDVGMVRLYLKASVSTP